jgi:hypothetical protein
MVCLGLDEGEIERAAGQNGEACLPGFSMVLANLDQPVLASSYEQLEEELLHGWLAEAGGWLEQEADWIVSGLEWQPPLCDQTGPSFLQHEPA